MKTSSQIADYYIDSVDAYNKAAGKIGLALAIDDFVTENQKPLVVEIEEQRKHIENLQEQIQFLEGRLESRTSING